MTKANNVKFRTPSPRLGGKGIGNRRGSNATARLTTALRIGSRFGIDAQSFECGERPATSIPPPMVSEDERENRNPERESGLGGGHGLPRHLGPNHRGEGETTRDAGEEVTPASRRAFEERQPEN